MNGTPKTEETLHPSLSNADALKRFISDSNFAMAMFDLQMNYLAVSPRWMRELVRSEINVLGRSHYEIFKNIPDRWKEIHRRCFAGETLHGDRDIFLRDDGGVQYLKWEVRPWRLDERVAGIIISTEDITKSVLAEEALKVSEARFRALVDNAPEAIVVLDIEKGTFVDANERAADLYGMPKSELLKVGPVETSPLRQPSGELSSELAAKKIAEAVEGGIPVFEWLHKSKDGSEILTEIRLVRLPTEERILLRGSVTDITERKKTEAALKNYMRELSRSNQELEEFAYIASHDLRSPLASIVNWIQVLDSMLPAGRSEEIQQAIDIIQNNSAKAVSLINDVMAMSRVNVLFGNPQMVNLDDLVKNILEDLEYEIRLSRAIVKIGVLPSVKGLPNHLESLFKNLIQNAIQYRSESRPLAIEITCVKNQDHWVFSIQDNGIGIDPKNHRKIFNMFTRLHSTSSRSGSGIGLAFCKKIVELTGGQIWVKSELGQGSRFSFSYPAEWKWTSNDQEKMRRAPNQT